MVVRHRNPANIVTLAIFVLINMCGLFSDKIAAVTGLSKYSLCVILNIICFVVPAVFLALYRRREMTMRSCLRLKGIKLRYLPVSVSAGVAVTLLCLLLNAAVAALFSLSPESGLPTAVGRLDFAGWLSVGFTAVLLPAVSEELYFRGSYPSQYSEFPRFDVIIAAALCFTMLHGSLRNIITPFVCSVVYALLVYMTGSIWSAVVAHIINNAIAVAAAFYAEALAKSELKWVIYVTFLIVFFIFLYLTLRFFEKYYLKSKKRKKGVTIKEAKKRRLRQSPFSPAFFVLAVLFVLKLVFEATGFWA